MRQNAVADTNKALLKWLRLEVRIQVSRIIFSLTTSEYVVYRIPLPTTLPNVTLSLQREHEIGDTL